jgi:phage tail-like protein
MAKFPVNTQRLDPYKNFKFRVKFDGQEVPEVAHIVADDDAEVKAVTLERGHTDDTSFKQWMDSVVMLAAQPQGLEDISSIVKDIRVEQHDEAGKLVKAWTLRGCRPKRYQPHPAAMEQQVADGAVERLTLLYDDAELEA